MYNEIRITVRVKQPNKETKTQCDDQDLTAIHFSFKFSIKNSRTPFIRINWDGEASEYAKNLDNWSLLLKYGTLAV